MTETLPHPPLLPGTPPVADEVPATNITTSTTDTTTTSQVAGKPSWVSAQLRNFVVIALTVGLLYLALMEKNEIAIAAMITAWTWSAGGMFQERAALKVKNIDT